MIRRLQKLHPSRCLFLFGARGTGKTTLLKEKVSSKRDTLWIDLLTEKDEEHFGRRPDQLFFALEKKAYKTVVIDEVQKFPKLLDVVHKCIETWKQIQFIMTGSSSRKLKRGGR